MNRGVVAPGRVCVCVGGGGGLALIRAVYHQVLHCVKFEWIQFTPATVSLEPVEFCYSLV